MKHKIELDNLLSAIDYCAMAGNTNDIWERWDRLKVTEQLEALANVTFFDDWQTQEQMEFALHRAEKYNEEYQKANELLVPFWDVIPETPENRHLCALFYDIELHIMQETHELREYIRAKKEPEKTQGQKEIDFIHRVFAQNEQQRSTQPKPEPKPKQEQGNNKMRVTPWLKNVFGSEELANDYLDQVKYQLSKTKQKPKAVIDRFIFCNPQNYKYENNDKELAEQLEQCTGVKVTRQNIEHYTLRLHKLPIKK